MIKIVSGPLGVGKKTLVEKMLQSSSQNIKHVFWIDATNVFVLYQTIVRIYETFKLNFNLLDSISYTNIFDIWKTILIYFSTNDKVLIIFKNAQKDVLDILKTLLSDHNARTNISFLIITRLEKMTFSYDSKINVTSLKEQDSLMLLKSHLKHMSHPDITSNVCNIILQVCTTLEHNPMYITLFASYVNETSKEMSESKRITYIESLLDTSSSKYVNARQSLFAKIVAYIANFKYGKVIIELLSCVKYLNLNKVPNDLLQYLIVKSETIKETRIDVLKNIEFSVLEILCNLNLCRMQFPNIQFISLFKEKDIQRFFTDQKSLSKIIDYFVEDLPERLSSNVPLLESEYDKWTYEENIFNLIEITNEVLCDTECKIHEHVIEKLLICIFLSLKLHGYNQLSENFLDNFHKLYLVSSYKIHNIEQKMTTLREVDVFYVDMNRVLLRPNEESHIQMFHKMLQNENLNSSIDFKYIFDTRDKKFWDKFFEYTLDMKNFTIFSGTDKKQHKQKHYFLQRGLKSMILTNEQYKLFNYLHKIELLNSSNNNSDFIAEFEKLISKFSLSLLPHHPFFWYSFTKISKAALLNANFEIAHLLTQTYMNTIKKIVPNEHCLLLDLAAIENEIIHSKNIHFDFVYTGVCFRKYMICIRNIIFTGLKVAYLSNNIDVVFKLQSLTIKIVKSNRWSVMNHSEFVHMYIVILVYAMVLYKRQTDSTKCNIQEQLKQEIAEGILKTMEYKYNDVVEVCNALLQDNRYLKTNTKQMEQLIMKYLPVDHPVQNELFHLHISEIISDERFKFNAPSKLLIESGDYTYNKIIYETLCTQSEECKKMQLNLEKSEIERHLNLLQKFSEKYVDMNKKYIEIQSVFSKILDLNIIHKSKILTYDDTFVSDLFFIILLVFKQYLFYLSFINVMNTENYKTLSVPPKSTDLMEVVTHIIRKVASGFIVNAITEKSRMNKDNYDLYMDNLKNELLDIEKCFRKYFEMEQKLEPKKSFIFILKCQEYGLFPCFDVSEHSVKIKKEMVAKKSEDSKDDTELVLLEKKVDKHQFNKTANISSRIKYRCSKLENPKVVIFYELRESSNTNAMKLMEQFKQLGYNTEAKWLTNNMDDCIQMLSLDSSLNQFDGLILVFCALLIDDIQTSENQDIRLHTGKKYIRIKDINFHFSEDHCKQLKDKPKIFLYFGENQQNKQGKKLSIGASIFNVKKTKSSNAHGIWSKIGIEKDFLIYFGYDSECFNQFLIEISKLAFDTEGADVTELLRNTTYTSNTRQSIQPYLISTLRNTVTMRKKRYANRTLELNWNEDIWAQLDAALKKGKTDRLRKLLKRTQNLRSTEKNELERLVQVSKYDYKYIKNLFKIYKPDVNSMDENDQTPLHHASIKGHLDMVKLLLEYNANVNCFDKYNSTPLHYAVKENHIEIVELLLKHYADISCMDIFDHTPLFYASKDNITKLLKPRKSNLASLLRLKCYLLFLALCICVFYLTFYIYPLIQNFEL